MGEARVVIDEMAAPRAVGSDGGRARRSLLVAGAGLATGGLTLLGQAALDAEWNRLANSGAIWLAVAFAVGSRMASDREAVIAGTATLLFALVGYQLAARVMDASIGVTGLVIWSGRHSSGGPSTGSRAAAGERAPVVATSSRRAPRSRLRRRGCLHAARDPGPLPGRLDRGGRGLALPVLLGRGVRERVAGVALLVPLACAGLLVFEVINRLFLAG